MIDLDRDESILSTSNLTPMPQALEHRFREHFNPAHVQELLGEIRRLRGALRVAITALEHYRGVPASVEHRYLWVNGAIRSQPIRNMVADEALAELDRLAGKGEGSNG